MRAHLLLLLLSMTGLAACGGPPDIVLVTISSLRRDHVGAYGWKLPGDSPTPHLDALAADARVFEGAATTMPIPTAAHASILTGLPPAKHGVVANGQQVPEAVAAEHGLPGRLAAAGYRVAAFVSTKRFGDRFGLGGFEPWDAKAGGSGRGADAVARALDWLDRTGKGEDRPVFVWIQLQDVHAPYGGSAARKAGKTYDLESYGFVDRARYKDKRARIAMMARYAEGVREADAALGVLLAGLAEREREPLILVAADHGEFMAEPLDRIGFAYGHGVLLGPEVAWVPLVAAGPGVDAARVAGAASLTDLYTTILEASGVGDPAAELEGRVDLLGPLPDGRVVHTARRALSAKQLAKRGAHSAAIRAIAQRAVAVTDGTSLVLVGEDGKPAEPGPGAPPALVAAAQSFLVAQRVAPAPVASPPAAAGSPRR